MGMINVLYSVGAAKLSVNPEATDVLNIVRLYTDYGEFISSRQTATIT